MTKLLAAGFDKPLTTLEQGLKLYIHGALEQDVTLRLIRHPRGVHIGQPGLRTRVNGIYELREG